jgi:hypothetical protein
VDLDRTSGHGPASPEILTRKAIRIPINVRIAHGQDGATVLDIHRGQMFRLNYVGSRIIELLKEGFMEPEIADRLAREFGIERVVAEADLLEFLQTLEKHLLLVAQSESSLP